MGWFGERSKLAVFDALMREPERVFSVLGKRFRVVFPCAWAKIGQEGVCEGLGLEGARWYMVCAFDHLREVLYVPVGEFFDVTIGLSSRDGDTVCITGTEPATVREPRR